MVRLASAPLSVPAGVAPLISGITGVDETLATHDSLTGAGTRVPQRPALRDVLRAAVRHHRSCLRRRLPRSTARRCLRVHPGPAAGRLRPVGTHRRRSGRKGRDGGHRRRLRLAHPPQ
jgi:hypothetical protein